MKLCSLFILLGFLHVSAESLSQTVTLNVTKHSLRQVLDIVKAQTGYLVVYKHELLESAKPVTVNASGQSVSDFLDRLFKDQPFNYTVEGKTILITAKSGLKGGKKQVSVVERQDRTITGKVTNQDGEALEGVTVQLKGTAIASKTDSVGAYQIQIGGGDAVLVFTSIGFQTQEKVVFEVNAIDVVLESSFGGLDEVVVVGYGVQKKETVTGAIASIQTKEIKQSPASNLAVTLAGRLPGLTAIQRSGEPGRETAQLFIRGVGTINAQNPIILVDGVERDLTYIDPNEVESVTILKDASSTAIFGVRGANGVILVTTRRGTSEKPEISFSAEASAQDFTRLPKPVNSFDYAQLRNLALQNDGLPYQYSAEEIEKFRTGEDPVRYPNTSWQKSLLKDYAPQQRYNLNVSGAGKSMKYFVNAGYLNQGGQFKTEPNERYDPSFKLDRYNFRSNIDLQLNKTLKAFLNVAGYVEKLNSPGGAYNLGVSMDRIAGDSPSLWIIAYMNDINATIPGPLTPDGGVIATDNIGMPSYGQINRSGYINRSTSNVTATYGMEKDLAVVTPGLSAKAIISYDTRAINNFYALKTYPRYVMVIDRNLAGQDGLDSVYYRPFDADEDTPLSLLSTRFYTTKSNAQGYLNYDRVFAGGHAVTGLMLYQQEKTVINGELPYNLHGLSSRFTYGYRNRYFVEFNAGYNGSEQFAKGRRFGFFPAYSVGWVASNEDFLSDNPILTYLKVRGSYGHVGNDRIGGRRFLYLDNIQVGGGGSNSLGRGQTISVQSLRNEMLQWEVARKTNFGLEVGLFNELNLILDVFSEQRDNILRNRGTIPELMGISSATLPPANVGIIDNKGYELELNYRKIVNSDFSFLTKLNVNYAKNKQIFADEPLLPDDFAYRYRQTNYPIGQQWGFIADGFFANEADVAASPVQQVGGHASRPGDLKFRDLNGDGVVDIKDVAPIGYSAIPEYTFGGAFNVIYKQFDISMLFQGVTNVNNFYRNRNIFPLRNFYSQQLQSWTQERADNGEKITYPRLTTEANPNENNSTFFNLDASYLRLKNAEIGYAFPQQLSNKIGAQRIRIYANGFNLLTWDRLPTKNFDPEISDDIAEGYSYPVVRFYNIGVNVTF